ncbi:alpha-1-macroglobulin-like isoform X2 [Eupeodes corollae]|uniref:alpha-1-macroglobulin-like isoform X2 n=1 Tax=Eupeodes corollae TaxID=290404 RepID=UPI002492AB1E|nr:alpha-1-macroglobulin-like isoform X2 [Eupeodes corollae]
MLIILTRYLFDVLIILNLFHDAVSIKKGYYTVVAPSYILPDSTFHISFTLNDFHKSCWFNISIKSYATNDTTFKFNAIEVKPGTTKLVKLQAPHFNSSIGDLKVVGYRGIISENSELVYFDANQYWTFIQTNKPKYKPGELFKFRVICIDQLGRPAKLLNEEILVQIYDDQNNLVRSILNVKFVKGVFKSEFQLSDFPVLGIWNIRVQRGEKIKAIKKIEVSRYVLPKFKVDIKKRNVFLDEGKITLEFSANYFYDEPVKGNLTVIIINTQAPYPEEIQTLKSNTVFDGKARHTLDFKKHIHLNTEQSEAIVNEDLKEEQSWTTAEFEIYSQPYKIEINSPSVFRSEPIIKIKVEVFIKDIHGNSIEDPKAPIEIVMGCSEKANEYNQNEIDIIRNSYKKQIGENSAEINVTNKNYSECYIYAEFERSKSNTIWMRKSPLDVEILTESPQEGKKLDLKIISLDPIGEFTYEIVSRKDIIQSDHVIIPDGNATIYILSLDVTSAMVPKITFYVHHIKSTGFRGNFKDVAIKRMSSNSIKIETEKETTPGTSVYVNVTTNKGSYVGLMGLDQSALQSIKKDEIFDSDKVDNELGSVNAIRNYQPILDYGGKFGDIITFSNAFLDYARGGAGGGGFEEKRIRKHFPESWLYMDFEETPEGGIHFMETAPDTITTWVITGFSIHPDTGLTFTKNAKHLKVFQKFFISMDIPSLVKEGEIVEVPVYISNYMKQEALTDVTIETDSEYLDLLESPETESEPKKMISKQVSVKKREKMQFFMKPLKAGNHNVTVNAISSVASDAIQKTLYVQPEGIPFSMSKTYLVNLPQEGEQEDELTIDIPKNDVVGSERVEVSIVGDIFRPLMKNLQDNARAPYGNGEDNMKLIICNTIALKYLKALNYSNPSLENKIRLNLELGYQNQLSYKYLDGSFGFFERKTERSGDVWQTVLTLWGLEQANEFVNIEPTVIDRGLEYLKSKQQENGCFKSEKDGDGGIEQDVKITAFSLMVFLMHKDINKNSNKLNITGFECLFDIADDLEYSPISVMAAYVLHLGKHKEAENFVTELSSNSRLKNEDKQVQLTKSDTLESHLESTTESLIHLFENQDKSKQNLLHIVRGLIAPKKDEERESTTITHMVALQAMIEFVGNLQLRTENLDISIKDDQDKSGRFRVNSENSQVLQVFEISQKSQKIKVQSKGHGFAVIDLRYSYNLVPEDQPSSLYTISISTMKTSKHLGILKICSSSDMKNTQNKLTVLEINLQSGFICNEKDSEDEDDLGKDVKSKQINEGRDKIIIYFELKPKGTCNKLEVRNTYKVFNSKPGWVVVFGAHDKDKRTTRSFRFNDF